MRRNGGAITGAGHREVAEELARGPGSGGPLAGLGAAAWLTGPPLLPVVHAAEAPVAGTTTGDVIRTLARERTLGEVGAGLLKDFAATDPARMVQGRLEGVGELLGGAVRSASGGACSITR